MECYFVAIDFHVFVFLLSLLIMDVPNFHSNLYLLKFLPHEYRENKSHTKLNRFTECCNASWNREECRWFEYTYTCIDVSIYSELWPMIHNYRLLSRMWLATALTLKSSSPSCQATSSLLSWVARQETILVLYQKMPQSTRLSGCRGSRILCCKLSSLMLIM